MNYKMQLKKYLAGIDESVSIPDNAKGITILQKKIDTYEILYLIPIRK
jgi:hypothetical protein